MEAGILAVGTLMIALAAASRASLGSWLSPGAFFAAFWALCGGIASILASLLLEIKISPFALAFICAFVSAMWVGDYLGASVYLRQAKKRGCQRRIAPNRTGTLALLILFLSFCGLMAPLLIVRDQGRSIFEMTNIMAWMSFASEISFARYNQDYVEPPEVRALQTGLYLAALFGGLLLAQSSMRVHKVIAWLPTIVGTAIAAVTTAKASFLFPLLMTAASYTAFSSLAPRRIRQSFGRLVLRLGIVAIVIAGLFVGSLMVRYKLTDLSQWALIVERLGGYGVGHMSALSAWLEVEGVASTADLTWGSYTFVGPFSAVFGLERKPGIYDAVVFNDYLGESNVFTALRGLVSDFSFPGSLVLCVALSGLAGWHYQKLKCVGWNPVSYGVLTGFYLFTMWSHVVNAFAYNSIIIATAAFVVLAARLLRGKSIETRDNSAVTGS